MAFAMLAGRVVTVDDERLAPASVPPARTWAVAARCSAALLGLDAVKADCWLLSLGACIANVHSQHAPYVLPCGRICTAVSSSCLAGEREALPFLIIVASCPWKSCAGCATHLRPLKST